MSFTVAPFPGDLPNLSTFLSQAADGELAAAWHEFSGTLQCIGPIPTYVANPRAIADDDWSSVAQSGWRALLVDGSNPLGVLDITGTLDDPDYALRDADAAQAFADALRFAESLVLPTHELRWLTLPGVHSTFIWLAGPDPLFVPTRVGAARVTADLSTSQPQLVDQTARLVQEMSAAVGALGGAAGDDDDSETRSGL